MGIPSSTQTDKAGVIWRNAGRQDKLDRKSEITRETIQYRVVPYLNERSGSREGNQGGGIKNGKFKLKVKR